MGNQWLWRLAPLLVGTGVLTVVYGVGEGTLVVTAIGVAALAAGIATVARLAQARQDTAGPE